MKKTLIIAVLVYVTCYIGHVVYMTDKDLLQLKESQSIVEWLIRLFRDIGILTAASLAITLSFRNYITTKKKHAAKIYIIASVFVSLSFAIISGYAYYKSERFLKIIAHPIIETPEEVKSYEQFISSDKKDLQHRIRISQSIASSLYRDTGKRINVVSKNGRLEKFTPTQEDHKKLKDTIYVKKYYLHTKDSMKYSFIAWLLVLVISVLAGILSCNRCNANN